MKLSQTDVQIAVLNASTVAGNVAAALIAANLINESDITDFLVGTQEALVRGTFGLIAALEIEELFAAPTAAAPARAGGYSRPSGGGGGRADDNGAGFPIKFGKHAGKTLAQAYQTDPDWVEWTSREGKGVLQQKASEYLASIG